jgi:hypothetical protein
MRVRKFRDKCYARLSHLPSSLRCFAQHHVATSAGRVPTSAGRVATSAGRVPTSAGRIPTAMRGTTGIRPGTLANQAVVGGAPLKKILKFTPSFLD